MSTSVMTDRVTQAWPRLYARIAGALYLIVIVGGIFAEIFVRGRLVVHGDAAATAHNIQAHELLYRLGFVVEVFYCVCNVPSVSYTHLDVYKRQAEESASARLPAAG